MVKLSEDQAIGVIGDAIGDEAEYGPTVEGKCNAKIKSKGKDGEVKPPRRCTQDAGHGTDHPGFGPCKHHFGSTGQVRRGATKQMYEAEFAGSSRFGQIREIDPMTGILQEIGRTNGFIQYLEERIGQDVVDGKNEDVRLVYEDANSNVHIEPLVAIWRAERAHFARICKMAGDMGIAAAAIDLARVMGDRLADLIELIVRDLGMDPDDPIVDRAVRARLILLSQPKEIGA